MTYEFSSPVYMSRIRSRVGAPVQPGFVQMRNMRARPYGFAALGTETTDPAAVTRGLQSLLGSLSGSAAFRASLSQASGYINLVLGAAQIGTGIASSACSGCDRTGIDVTNNIIGWIRALLNGSSPTLSGLTADQIRGFADFCRSKDAVKGGIDAAFGIAMAAAYRDANAQNALQTLNGFLDNFLDSICAIPQVAAITASMSCPPNATLRADGQCECMPGFQSQSAPGQCLPVQLYCDTNAPGTVYDQATNSCVTRTSIYRPGILTLPSGTRPVLTLPPEGGGGSSSSSGGGVGTGVIVAAVLAALGLGYWYVNKES